MITKLTFDTGDMKSGARKNLESCMAYLTAGTPIDLTYAAREFGAATVWLDMLSDIGIELADQDEHVAEMLRLADERGLSY